MSTGFYVRRRFTAPVGGVVKGTAYLIGSLLVVARANANAAALFTAAVGGTWTLPKTSAQAWTEGQPIYWDDSNHRLDSDVTVGKLVGAAAAVAANPSATGSVLLNGIATGAIEGIGVDATELGLLNGATVGSITASKAVTRTAAQGIPLATAVVAAIGSTQGGGTAGALLTKDVNLITSADGTKCVVLPAGVVGESIIVVNTDAAANLPVFPPASGNINAIGANSAFTMGPGRACRFTCTAADVWYADPLAATTATLTQQNYLSGVATPGTTVASKAAVLGATKNLDILGLPVGGLKIGPSGAEVAVTATAAELNAMAAAVGGFMSSNSYIKSDTGTKTLLAAHATKDRGVLVVVTVDQVFADNAANLQPVVTIGDASNASKGMPNTTLVNAAAGARFVFGFNNISTNLISATLTAASGDGSGTGAFSVLIIALPNS